MSSKRLRIESGSYRASVKALTLVRHRLTHVLVNLNGYRSDRHRLPIGGGAGAISGAKTSSEAIGSADPLFDTLPGEPRSRAARQVRFSTGQFLLLPVMHRNCVRRAGKVVPKIFHQLEFVRWA